MFSGDKHQAALDEAAALSAQGKHQHAINTYRHVLRHDPDHADAHHGMANAKMRLASYSDARDSLYKVITQRPDRSRAYVDLASCYASMGRIEKAHERVDQALDMTPEDASAVRLKAELHRVEGEYETAHTMLKELLDSGDADINAMLSYARVCHRYEGAERSIEIAREIMGYEGIPAHYTSQAAFLLGRTLDAEGRYDEAFDAFAHANRLRGVKFDIAGAESTFRAWADAWTPEAAAEAPDSGAMNQSPVFVVGMPRSGTTLVERIIGSHHRGHPGGERHEITLAGKRLTSELGNFMLDPSRLEAGALKEAAEDVLQTFELEGVGADRVVDKMPSNALRLPLIAKLFPKAKVIHMVRDPRDTCLSCYFHSFTGANPFAYDLTGLGRYCVAHDELVEKYKAALGLDVLEVRYESLIHDQKGVSRAILEHVGLDWHDDVLRFYEKGGTSVTSSNEQVRQRLYASSVGRWKNYQEHLGPLLAALGDHASSD